MGSREKELLTRFVLDRAQTDIVYVATGEEWSRLSSASHLTSWVLLLCNNDGLPDCLVGDERTKLSAAVVSANNHFATEHASTHLSVYA